MLPLLGLIFVLLCDGLHISEFSDQFSKIAICYNRKKFNIDIIKQTACLVVDPPGSTADLLSFRFSSGLVFHPGIFRCLNTSFLLSPQLCFIISFTCDLFVACNYLWVNGLGKDLSTRAEQICFYR